MANTTITALATAATLAGAAISLAGAGCSPAPERSKKPAKVVDNPPDPGAAPAEEEAKRPRRDRESRREEPSTCVATEPIDATDFPYKPAGATPGACTTEEASTIKTYFEERANDERFTVSEWARQVSPGCARCVFSDGSGPTWTPIISKDDDVHTIDRGGCIEVLSGSEACGRAYQQITECSLVACLPKSEGGRATCENQQELLECLYERDAIFEGACRESYDAVVDACGDALEEHEKECEGRYTFEGPIRVMCVTG